MQRNKFLLLLSIPFFCASAFGNVNLKGVQITEGSQVELIFDGKVDVNQVKTEFVREHIQLSLLKTSVYPAKVNLVQGKELTKVFAYQYAPELVRCRLTMKGDAAKYQNRLQVKANGKNLIVKILPDSGTAETVSVSNSSAERAPATNSGGASAAKSAPAVVAAAAPAVNSELNADERTLMERVMRNEKVEVAPEKTEKVEKAEKGEKGEKAERTEKLAKSEKSDRASGNGRLTTSKNPQSSFRWVGMMLLVFGLLGGFLFFLSRLKGAGADQSKGLKKFLGKLGGNLGQKKMISVVSTLPLGPKKSIAVVQIQNRMLVLGMSNENVNLITEFRADEEDFDLAETMNLKDFATGIRELDDERGDRKAIGAEPSSGRRMTNATGPEYASVRGNSAYASQASSALVSRESRDEGPTAPINATYARVPPAPVGARTQTQVSGYGASSKPVDGNVRNGGPAFSEILKEENAKGGIRAQVRSRLEGMKQL